MLTTFLNIQQTAGYRTLVTKLCGLLLSEMRINNVKVSQYIFGKDEEEYIRYCIELEQVLSMMEAYLNNPDGMTPHVLEMTCDFYGGAPFQ